nr:hypothetical protein [Erythrotrichia foliiformis]
MIKMALEPQLEVKLFCNNHGFRPGRNPNDTIEHLSSLLLNRRQVVANVNLSNSLLEFDNHIFLEKIKAPPIIRQKIKKWLLRGIVQEYLAQSSSFDNHVADLPRGCILAPLLVNVVLHDIQLEIHEQIVGSSKNLQASGIICYGFHCIIIAESQMLLTASIQKLHSLLLDYGAFLGQGDFDIKYVHSGFNFLNYQIMWNNTKNISTGLQIVPSSQAIQLFNQQNREIIQMLKSGPLKLLIRRLKVRILNWGEFYVQYNSKRTFYYIDQVLFSQIRAAILRRHPNKSKHWITQKYFPSKSLYYFKSHYYQASWVLTDRTSLVQEFLPKMQWLKDANYVKVIESKSIYDTDFLY